MRPEQPKILIVDDDLVNLKVLDKMLKREGYLTALADNGTNALKAVKSEKPDLILLDIMMPEVDGFQVCNKLQQDPQTAEIPVIFLSALDDIDNKLKAFKIGAVDYISKPFERAEVLARVSLHLKLSISVKTLTYLQAEKFKQIHDAQQAILVSPDDIPKSKFGVKYSSILEAGGDFYDVVSISEDIFGYFVADISGHDLTASFTTPAIKALIAQYSSPIYTTTDILKNINSVIYSMMSNGNHLTASYVKLNRSRGQLEIANAGHTPVIYALADGQTDIIESTGDVLGAFEKVYFEPVTRYVSKGDRFYMYSDGLIEGFGPNKRNRTEGLELLSNATKASMKLPIQEAVNKIYAELIPDEAAKEDDVVLLGVEI